MPSGKNWFEFIFVNIIFIIGILIIVMINFISSIRQNWPLYRCNPLYMPLSKNMESDFTFCVQDMQKNMMGSYMQPFNYILGNMGDITGGFMDNINDARKMSTGIRGFNLGSATDIFGIFNNVIVEFQKMLFAMKDIMGKVIGVVMVFIYTMESVFETGSSVIAGPIGFLMSTTQTATSCFDPETKIRLKNGNIVCMKDLHLGDRLENGSMVRATMQIDNTFKELYYKMEGKGVHKSDIYVTGTHYIYSKQKGKFVQVKYHEDAVVTDTLNTEWLSCIITDDHKIKIGDYLFWDWQDHLIH